MTLFNVKGVFSLPLVQVDQVDDTLQSQPDKKNAHPNNIFTDETNGRLNTTDEPWQISNLFKILLIKNSTRFSRPDQSYNWPSNHELITVTSRLIIKYILPFQGMKELTTISWDDLKWPNNKTPIIVYCEFLYDWKQKRISNSLMVGCGRSIYRKDLAAMALTSDVFSMTTKEAYEI